MADAKVVYALSAGCYSDYRVLCVCEDEEEAKVLASAYNATDEPYDPVDVETFYLYPKGSKPQPIQYHTASGVEGQMEVNLRTSHSLIPVDSLYDQPLRKRPEVKRYEATGGSLAGKVRWVAVGTDANACIKAVKDRLAAAKAAS